jgi:hypothetical protein
MMSFDAILPPWATLGKVGSSPSGRQESALLVLRSMKDAARPLLVIERNRGPSRRIRQEFGD